MNKQYTFPIFEGDDAETMMTTPPLNLASNRAYTEPKGHFLELFAEQVAINGPRRAITFKQQQLSYRELDRLARRYAACLIDHGVTPHMRVAISIDRSENTLAALLAIWMCRCAYVPLDPYYPEERKRYVLECANADLLILEDEQAAWLPRGTKTLALQTLTQWENPANSNATNLADFGNGCEPDDLAYVIFTSGSTGKPKGVMVTQRNVNNFLLGMQECFHLGNEDRILAVTTISFDIHVLEFFLPLSSGSEIILASRQDAQNQSELRDLINRYQVNFLQATPATWRMILAGQWRTEWSVTKLVGGEALSPDLRDQLLENPGAVWNMYGPTETTVWSTCHRISSDNDKILIGQPIRNTQCYVVNEVLEPVASGIPGELLIGGEGVTRGYFDNVELTQERFIVYPPTGEVTYRTGDRVIMSDNGDLEYLDRLDNQIKIRGFRIEPSEIEGVLMQMKGITMVEVLAVPVSSQDIRLVACYIGEQHTPTEFRDFCGHQLPAFMVPQHFLKFDDFPLTDNLKVNRKQLTVLAGERLRANTQTSNVNSLPRDDLDRGLIRVWARTLGIETLSIDDNFFELGGHSLLALKASADALKICGVDIPPSAIFSAPTIRQLRDYLGANAHSSATVIRLNTSKKGDPIYCLAGVTIYQKLAEHFCDERPVFGVFADVETSFIDSEDDRIKIEKEHMDKLVEQYILAIKRQNSGKKLSLVGLSFGGFVAMDVAKILIQQGYEVQSVTLIDSYYSGSRKRTVSKVLVDLYRYAATNGLREFSHKIMAGLRKAYYKYKPSIHKSFDKELEQVSQTREKAFHEATEAYRDCAHCYDFDIHLVRTEGTSFGLGYYVYPDYGLHKMVTGDIHVSNIPGVHNEVMFDENIGSLYRVMKDYDKGHP